ncbi:ATP-dependent helicase C-terminal domain-containing protein, partial [Amycolatopsis sp. H20-H5]|uniref:ATP-dependent helicase C-terminal domain-containing protein n=1 Tax=Amycolatopsis sp. H20-H5 TaxID=3046309 RepID=UPI002DBE815D
VGARSAAEVVALLDSGGTLTDVEAELRRLRGSGDDGARRWKTEVRRLSGLVDGGGRGRPDAALVVALAHPERLARRRAAGTSVYLMAGGTAAELPGGSGLGDVEWLAVAEATRDPGRVHGTIRLAAAADAGLAVRAAPNLVTESDEVAWSGGDVVAQSVRRLGAIVLASKPLRSPGVPAVRAALLDGLRAEGLNLLRWTADGKRLRERMGFLHRVLGPPWPPVDDHSLLSTVDTWLDLSRARRRSDLATIDAGAALRGLLPWPAASRLDELAPDRLEVPSGSHIRVDYTGDQPVLAVKLQETFGWLQTPALADGRAPVVLHLLSPAGRPAAVTADQESFWRNGYTALRADHPGRYPPHPRPPGPPRAPPPPPP